MEMYPIIFRVLEWIETVSYTHLDVYKRQELLQSLDNTIVSMKVTLSYYIEPVSYTHLDVYKRQPFSQSLHHIPDATATDGLSACIADGFCRRCV